MRDVRDAKAMAQTLRSSLSEHDLNLSHAECLELIARLFGTADWNTLSALIKRREAELAAPSPLAVKGVPAKLAQVELGCTDLEAARTYYCDVLGLPFVGVVADSLFVRCGDVNLIVQQSANPPRGRTVYFSGDGCVQELTTALKARGVVFSQEPRRIARGHEGYDVWLGFFTDPWGNPFGLLGNMPPAAD